MSETRIPNLLVRVKYRSQGELCTTYYEDKLDKDDDYYETVVLRLDPLASEIQVQRGIKPASGGKAGL